MFGAIAMAVHGLPRTTEDADFFIAPTAENVERLERALRRIWDDPAIDEISAEDLLGEYPFVMDRRWTTGRSTFSPGWEGRVRMTRCSGRRSLSKVFRSYDELLADREK